MILNGHGEHLPIKCKCCLLRLPATDTFLGVKKILVYHDFLYRQLDYIYQMCCTEIMPPDPCDMPCRVIYRDVSHSAGVIDR